MTFMDRLRGALRLLAGAEKRAITYEQFDGLGISTPAALSGIRVSPETALTFSAYFNAIDIISGQVASLPRIVYRRVSDEQRERATGLPAYKVLKQPNTYMTDFVFWQTTMAHALAHGNGWSEIEFDGSLRPIGLHPLDPRRMQVRVDVVKLANGNTVSTPRYIYDDPAGGQRQLEQEDLLHIPGLGFDGLVGYSVAHVARETIGLAIATEHYGASFFGNGSWFGAVLEHPGVMGEEAQARWKKSTSKEHSGSDRAHQILVLEEGMKVNRFSIPNDDAQFLATREFNVLEIARWFNLPPHKLKHKVGERPGGNLEASQIEFLTDTLRPWLIRIEQECTRKLLTGDSYYVEHMVDAILRADVQTRTTVYKTFHDMGVLSAAQIAAKENLPPPSAPPPTKPAPVPAPAAPPSSPPEPPVPTRALLVELVGRFVRKEAARARWASKRGAANFGSWINQFYDEERKELTTLLGLVVNAEAAERLVGDYFERSVTGLARVDCSDLERQVDLLVTGWERHRAVDLAEAVLMEGVSNAAA